MRERIECPILGHANKHGDYPALINSHQNFSYKQLNDAINLAVYNFKCLGIKPRERVALISPNSIEYIISLFALWRYGAMHCQPNFLTMHKGGLEVRSQLKNLTDGAVVPCLLSPRLPKTAVDSYLKKICCMRILNMDAVSGKPFAGTLAPPLRGGTALERSPSLVPGKAPGHRGRSGLLTSGKRLPEAAYIIANCADIMFTSGSSGEPKAAVHSFGNHYYNALAANEHIPVAPGDRWLLSLPLYHVGGMGILWRTFLAGGTVVIPGTRTEQKVPVPGIEIAKALDQFNITHVSLVPTQLFRLLSSPKNIPILKKMKAILVGGSSIPETLIRQALDARLQIYVSYGLTEMASQVATSKRLTKKDPVPRAYILRNGKVRIEKNGEILVKGKTLFKGYVQGKSIKLPVNKNGWFSTGDLGCLNKDGTLTVFGRKDNMFISGGENIQPEEIEKYLCKISGIIQAVVVPMKNEEFGARPVAFIETKKGMSIAKKKVDEFLLKYLPSFKLPEHIYAWSNGLREKNIKVNRQYFLELFKNRKLRLREYL